MTRYLMHVAWGIALATAIGAAGYFALCLDQERERASIALAAKEDRLASLTRTLAQVRKQCAWSGWHAVGPASGANEPGAPPPPCAPSSDDALAGSSDDEALGDHELTPEEITAARRFEVDQLEQQLKRERVDTEWAEDASSRIAALATQARLSVGRVDCRETLCRVELAHRDERSRDEDLSALVAQSPLEASMYVDVDVDGRSSVAYLARRGRELATHEPRAPLVAGPQANAPVELVPNPTLAPPR